MKKSTPAVVTVLALVGLLAWPPAAGKIKPTTFINPDFDFGYVELVAVLPLENLSNDRQSGVRATRLIITELLSSGTVDVVSPGEVSAALNLIAGIDIHSPSTDHVQALGKALGVQAIVLGSVTQSDTFRSGTASIPVVTLDVHMLETDTGTTVWAATHTEKGSGAGAKLLGTGGEPISETTRRCVRRLIKTLVD